MVRTIGKLKALTISKTLKKGLHGDGGGLWLQVSPSGSKSWLFRYMKDGKAHALGLGPFPDVSLIEARVKATEHRKMLIAGFDPLQVKRDRKVAQALDAAKTMVFSACTDAYFSSHEKSWHNAKHRKQWRATLAAYADPVIGNLPVHAVDTALVMRVLEPIWATKPETASRVRGRIELVLDWATVRGYRTGENPARWRGHLDHLLPKKAKLRRVAHHPALPYAQIPEFMAELRAQDGVAARALEFVILTAARTGEVRGCLWRDIDIKGKLWTVPAERMKAGREHRVPLCDRAIEILQEMKVLDGDVVFPGTRRGRPFGGNALLGMLDRMGRGDVTPHGFRSSFRDWAAERTSYPREVAEMALAHTVGDQVERAYRRGDLFEKRRQLMDGWARFCASPPSSGEVVPIAIRK
jgi:integrase